MPHEVIFSCQVIVEFPVRQSVLINGDLILALYYIIIVLQRETTNMTHAMDKYVSP